jgi:hypothetical protein
MVSFARCTQHDAICTILFMVLCRAAIRCVNHGRNKANRLRDRQLRPKQRMNQLGMTSQTSSTGQPELAVLAVLAESGGIWRGRSLFFFRWNLPLSSDPSCASESTTKASGSAFLSFHSSVRPSVRPFEPPWNQISLWWPTCADRHYPGRDFSESDGSHEASSVMTESYNAKDVYPYCGSGSSSATMMSSSTTPTVSRPMSRQGR